MRQQKMCEYFDRLSNEKIRILRSKFGGELGWKRARFSAKQKEEMGLIVFDMPVKNLVIEWELNYSNGWEIPVIIAEPA